VIRRAGWANSAFTAIQANLFAYDFPRGSKTHYKTTPARCDTGTNFTSGVAWNAFDLARQKPQVTAQATYYVPDKAGSHDLKVGFEYVLDVSKYTIDGRSGPIQYRDVTATAANPTGTNEIQSVAVGKNGALG